MACNSWSITSSPSPTMDTRKEHNPLARSLSAKALHDGSKRMERSNSEHYLCYSVNRSRIRASSVQPKMKTTRSFNIFKIQLSNSIIPSSLRSFLFDPETSEEMNMEEHEGDREDRDTNEKENAGNYSSCDEEYKASDGVKDDTEKRANWIERLVEVRTHWKERQQKDRTIDDDGAQNQEGCEDEEDSGCEVEYGEEEEEEAGIDCESFSKLLAQVSWSDAKNFARLAFLCNMAYVIPDIKANDLKRSYNLDFVTSSLKKKAEAASMKEALDEDSTHVPVAATSPNEESDPERSPDPEQRTLNRNAAYEIAASAASYVHSCAKDLFSLRSSLKYDDQKMETCKDSENQQDEEEGSSPRAYKSEVAAHMAASTMTVVVAAGETEKQQTAKDLRSLHSCPCEWFICDEPSTYTRCFVIQGSYSLASWQANLLFEPTKFEGTEALVHRGIYEAAKGIYEQFMPEIMDHLHRHGERAKLQFTGHSLGGSLSLMVTLMLLTRKIARPASLRPVVSFGSPFVFCGGHKILDELGVSEDNLHCVMMHRDVVPRAFSCSYPNHVAQILKRLSWSFRSHPCLNKKKLLYEPMGKIFILQPDPKSSPPHPFLPQGTALYALKSIQTTPHRSMSNALRAFLNSPHPLETLSDPKAYTSEGTIRRDHESSNYMRAVNMVIRQEHLEMRARRAGSERNTLWPLVMAPSPNTWGHDYDAGNRMPVNKEVVTSV